ncbi:hypothetical protein FKM82_022308 [Ascaphus truei]
MLLLVPAYFLIKLLVTLPAIPSSLLCVGFPPSLPSSTFVPPFALSTLPSVSCLGLYRRQLLFFAGVCLNFLLRLSILCLCGELSQSGAPSPLLGAFRCAATFKMASLSPDLPLVW